MSRAGIIGPEVRFHQRSLQLIEATSLDAPRTVPVDPHRGGRGMVPLAPPLLESFLFDAHPCTGHQSLGPADPTPQFQPFLVRLGPVKLQNSQTQIRAAFWRPRLREVNELGLKSPLLH